MIPAPKINTNAEKWAAWCAKKTAMGGVSFQRWGPFSAQGIKEAKQL